MARPYVRMVRNRAFKVKGVTFDNDDGTSRQEILKDIKRRRPPFDEDLCLCLEEYDYEGRPACYVKVNGSIIGVIPSYLSPFVTENRDNIIGLRDLEVSSFRDRDTGKTIYYAEATLAVSMDECGCESDVFDDDYEDGIYGYPVPEYHPRFSGKKSVRQGPSKSAKERRSNEAIRTRWLFAVFGIGLMALSIFVSAAHISVFVSVFTFLCSLVFLVYARYGFFKYWGREDED